MKCLYHFPLLTLMILISVIQPVGLYSQQFNLNGTISGNIIDAKSGEALFGAKIILKGTEYSGLSMYDGSFIIKNITPGDYELEINIIGYSKYTVSKFSIEPGGLKKIEVSMPDKAIQNDEAVVTKRAFITTGTALPNDELLSNNPNPFQNKTKVKYIVSESSHVKLYVYDKLGNRVSKLVDKKLGEGEYSLEWDSEVLPQGNYFLRLETGENVVTRQMVIAR